MVPWSKELADVELLPVERSEDEGFLSALLRFRSMSAAMEAKNRLDGRSMLSDATEMIVEVLSNSPPAGRRTNADYALVSSAGLSTLPTPRQMGRFNSFQALDSGVSPTSNGAFPVNDMFHDGLPSRHQQFYPQPPIGNHLTERPTRVSGKTLISSDIGDDDETTDLLKDPVAYAESGATSYRRATAPQLPLSHMAGLSLNTTHLQVSASLPRSLNQRSPVHTNAGGYGHHANGQMFPRSIPAVNPADQNPPCNTLYVGNLPGDTSEEELKAMFSKQRGYKRLCFRTKQNGPMCFVEFEDVTFATKTLYELYGQMLHNSVKGGIRLSFSKNPLGVRSGQAPSQGSSNAMGNMSVAMPVGGNGFSAHGPPPGLSAPPGLSSGRGQYHPASSTNTGGGGGGRSYSAVNGFAGGPNPNHPWNFPVYSRGVATSAVYSNGVATNGAATNGAATNGIATNGVATNGAAMNGAAMNGVTTAPRGGPNSNSYFPRHNMGR